MIVEIILFIIIFISLYIHAHYAGFKSFSNDFYLSDILIKDYKLKVTEDEIKKILFESKIIAKKQNQELKNLEKKIKENKDKIEPNKSLTIEEENIKEIEEQIKEDRSKNKKIEILSKIESIFKIKETELIFEILDSLKEYLSKDAKIAMVEALYDYSKAYNEPSVVNDSADEIREYSTSYDLLSKIKLVEHVLDVVEEALNLAKEFPGFFQRLVEPYLLMAIYHDIGKISFHREEYLSKEYRMLDHPVISAEILKNRYKDVDEKIIDAILHHHKQSIISENEYLEALKLMDSRAREKELKRVAKDAKKLVDVIDSNDIIEKLIEAYAEKEDLTSLRPKMFSISGYLLIEKDFYIRLIEDILNSKKILVQEQILSEKIFKDTAFQLLIDLDIITEKILKSKIYLERRIGGRSRKLLLKNYIAIPIEKLGILESSLEDDSYKGYKKIIFSYESKI